jgi:type IX secretion system substrate protein
MKALLLFSMLLFAGMVAAQENVITWSTFSTGYEFVASESSSAQGITGQIFVGSGNSDSTAVGCGFFAGFTPPNTTVVTSLSAGWNMVSVPVVVSDFQATSLYPGVSSNAFAFLGGSYTVQSTLANGLGYWVKYNGTSMVSMTGVLITLDTIDVVLGWNLIGSISHPVPVSSIISIPGGLVTSNFFEYHGSYVVADTIQPGNAYWVKTTGAGSLIFSSTNNSPSTNRIHIVPHEELPPSPPSRETASGNSLLPSEYSLDQNYPNPFNPSTIIRYSLPVESHVLLTIYDVLGREVATILDGIQDPGFKSVRWDASAAASGIYFYRLKAGEFTSVKKLLLLR